jgi:hypothetical protein
MSPSLTSRRSGRWCAGRSLPGTHQQSLFILWRQGVSAVTWFQVVDSPPVPSYAETKQGGVFFLDGREKPSAQAFRFPFVVSSSDADRAVFWGIAPAQGAVAIQQSSGKTWRTVADASAGADRNFSVTMKLGAATQWRAIQGTQMSLNAHLLHWSGH